MPSSPIIQRYLLAAQTAGNLIVTPSFTAASTLVTASVPVSGAWTIKLRRVSGLFFVQDNSGSLQVQLVRAFWQWLDRNNNPVFSLDLLQDYPTITPGFTCPKVLSAFGFGGDTQQVASNFDQGVSNTVVALQAGIQSVVLNTDAVNPHPFALQVNAVLEYEQPGSPGD